MGDTPQSTPETQTSFLDEALVTTIQSLIGPERIIPQVIVDLLLEQGITLSQTEVASLERQVQDPERKGSLVVSVDEKAQQGLSADQVRKRMERALRRVAPVSLRTARRIVKRLPEIVGPAMEATAGKVYEIVLASEREALQSHRRKHERFRRSISAWWRSAWDALDVEIGVCREAGMEFSEPASAAVKRGAGKDLHYVLLRLQARACRVASETLLLLANGYADGASARWRSLHEIAVAAAFIAKYGNKAARVYLDHEYYEARKSATTQLTIWPKLANDRAFMGQLARLNRRLTTLKARHGEHFDSPSGFAAPFMKGRPTIERLESIVDLSTLRPHYQIASYNVHAGVNGMQGPLGHADFHPDVIIAGPSPYGIDEVGKLAAWSLMVVTTTFLLHPVTANRLMHAHVIMKLAQRATNAFERVQVETEQQPPQEIGERKGRGRGRGKTRSERDAEG